MKKCVAVIGAGVSGLVTIKACLEEDLNVIAFELTGNVGGLWKYREEIGPNSDNQEITTVHNCTFMNSSKEISAFSDFPPPDDWPNFLHHKLAQDYMESYAKHFQLDKYIRFRHKVIKAKETKDPSGKRWTVDVEDLETKRVSSVEVDAVAVCAGQLGTPHRPHIKGLEKFKGQVIHSADYRTSDKYKGLKVAVIGIGNSGADVAVDLCNVALEIYISTRKGAWIFKRTGLQGLPNDIQSLTRFLMTARKYLPKNMVHSEIERRLSTMLNHEIYGLKPKHRPLQHGPTVNDDLPIKLLNGSLKLKKDVTEVLEDGILFQGDERVTKLDVIILCTGYRCQLPFLDIPDDVFWTPTSINLYKYIIPPDYGQGTLGLIGYVAAFGPVFPAFELQARWFASIVNGKTKLPSVQDMKADIKEAQRVNKETFVSGGERESWYCDYMPYVDDLAEKIGAKPNFTKMFWSDPVLFYKCFFGPLLAYQYRLEGPNAWPGAREAIISYQDRVLKAFKS